MQPSPAGFVDRNTSRIFVFLLLCIAITGCATAINLRTPLEAPRHMPIASRVSKPIAVADEPECKVVAEAIESYLRTSPYWSLGECKDAGRCYLLEWRIVSEKFQSDLATKRSAVVYFCCWIITAPIGLIYANSASWHATDFLEIQIMLKDPDGRMIYTHRETMTTSETDKTLPNTKSLMEAMRRMTASNLVNLMMNRMEKVVLSAEEKRAP